MFNLERIQDNFLAHLRNSIPQEVVEQAIPDAETVKKVDGKIKPYVAVQLGDIQDRLSGRSFSSVRTNDYELPIYVQVIAPSPEIARKIAVRNVLNAALGYSQRWTGEVRKRPGGGLWPIKGSNGATEAYLYPLSFAVTFQLSEEA